MTTCPICEDRGVICSEGTVVEHAGREWYTKLPFCIPCVCRPEIERLMAEEAMADSARHIIAEHAVE